MSSSSAKSKKREKRGELAELKTLGTQLLTSRAHVNNLPRILNYVNSLSPPELVLEALLSLHSFFAPVLHDLPSVVANASGKEKDEPELIYKTWLRSKFEEFVKKLIEICVASEADETLKEVVLDTIMEFVKIGNSGGFYSALYHRLLQNIVMSTVEEEFIIQCLSSKYFNYIDVRYFTYISVENIVKTLEAKNGAGEGSANSSDDGESSNSTDICIRKVHSILSQIPPVQSSEENSNPVMWSDSGGAHNNSKKNSNALSSEKLLKKMKPKFSKAWLSFLRLPLPLDVYKEVLVNLHQTVIPYLSKPAILCDFLTRSYDLGGVISVMALSSLFTLMTQHGLEYPNFYEKLYALLVPSVFIAKHRAKFFELLDLCVKSPLLPAYLAASFAKKLSRLALSVPPSGSLVIIALIHNLLRRHPSINCLVHRVDVDETKEHVLDAEKLSNNAQDSSAVAVEKTDKRPGVDHFNNETLDPSKTCAMRSSLWEIDTLRHHYCPPVSRFVLSLENDLTVRAKTTEIAVKDFSSGSYATIFGEEMRKRVKQVPTAFYKNIPSLFAESDFPGWTFKGEKSQKNDENEPVKRQKV